MFTYFCLNLLKDKMKETGKLKESDRKLPQRKCNLYTVKTGEDGSDQEKATAENEIASSRHYTPS